MYVNVKTTAYVLYKCEYLMKRFNLIFYLYNLNDEIFQ